MKYLAVLFVILSTCVVLEAYISEYHHDTGEEVIYRVTRATHGKKKDIECRYKKNPWSDCDSSNMQKKTLNLKRGDSSCEQTKVMTRNCKKACKYEKGGWSECETSTNSRTRTDSLKPKSDPSCQPTRTISKKCKKVCKYNKQGPWSECDSLTGKKTKVLMLKSGNPQACEAQKKITKSCRSSTQNGHKGGKTHKHDDYDED